MIDPKRKEDCVGCEGCRQKCPVKCIEMHEDEQGFNYAKADPDKCINCGICDRVCPVLNQDASRMPISVYAAWNDDDSERMVSSSGGIFYALAKDVINNNGIVFGARFDDKWQVIHDYADNLAVLRRFQGSKYVQSQIGDSYIKVESFLKQGRKVMFTGTPCQIAGLKLFLRKDWGDSLLLVDIVCHGVPSPLVWINYLESLVNDPSQCICDIEFRNKTNGWQKYSIAIRQSDNNDYIVFEPGYGNIFIWGFLQDLYLRPSCHECPAKCGKSHSDLTIADYWGINETHPDLFSDKGVSLVLVNTTRGNKYLLAISANIKRTSYDDALKYNPSIEKSSPRSPKSKMFWRQFGKKGIIAIQSVKESYKPSLFNRGLSKIKHTIRLITKR